MTAVVDKVVATGGKAEKRCILRHRSGVQCVCIVPGKRRYGDDLGDDGRELSDWLVATGDAQGRLSVGDPAIRRAVAVREQAHCDNYGIHALATINMPEMQYPLLVSQGRDGWIRAWDWSALGHLDEPVWQVNSGSNDFCAISCFDRLIASTSGDGECIGVWQVLGDEASRVIPKLEVLDSCTGDDMNTGMCMAVKSLDETVLALYEYGGLGRYSLKTNKWEDDAVVIFSDNVVPISFDVIKYDETTVRGVACGAGARVCAFSLRLNEEQSSKWGKVKASVQLMDDCQEESKRGFSAVRIAPNARIAACAGWDGSVRLLDWQRLAPLGTLYHHSKTVRELAFSPDTTMLVSVSEDAHAVCWDLPFAKTKEAVKENVSVEKKPAAPNREERIKSYELISPRMLEFNGSTIEVSAHVMPKALLRDVQLVFGEALSSNPKLDKSQFKLIPTIQETGMNILDVNDETALEKDQCLEVFEEFAKKFCNELRGMGCWADFCDPCSGLPMFCDGNTVYSEIQGLEKVRNFQTTNAGSCRVALHPVWGPNMYPATMFTDASSEQIQAVFVKLDDGACKDDKIEAAAQMKQKQSSAKPSLLDEKDVVHHHHDHGPDCDCQIHKMQRHPWFAANPS